MVDWFECIKDLDRPIVLYPLAIKAFGGYAEAAFVLQLRYWMGRCADPDGWVYKTAEQWEKELCLTPRQQEYVRENLKKLKVLETRYEREKHFLHYMLEKDVFNTLLETARALPKNVGAQGTPKNGVNHSQKEGQPLPKNVGGTPKKRGSFNTESTTENTTQSTQRSDASVSKSKYSTFQSRYYSLIGITPAKIPLLVNKYLELCSKYGEEAVLDFIPTWADGQGGAKSLGHDKYGPGHFLEQVETMLTTERVSDSDRKEASYPHGTEDNFDWDEFNKLKHKGEN